MMKKIVALILLIGLLISGIAGCSPKPTPESPEERKEYGYGELEIRDIKAIEITAEGARTPVIEEREALEQVALYISEAKFIDVANDPSRVEIAERGIKVYLKEELRGSDQIIVSHRESDEDRLYLGPEGHEYLVESRELVEYIKTNINAKVLIVEEEVLPKAAGEWFATFENEKGAYAYQHPYGSYIKINAGEKPTGGYSLDFKELVDEGYFKSILLELREPEEGQQVTQALTYPQMIIRVAAEEVSSYQIKTTDGEEFQVEDKIKLAGFEGLKQKDIITSPLRVKGKVAAFEGAFGIRILEVDNKEVHVAQLQAAAGAPNWGNFNAEISFPTVDAATGFIEIGEFSAKDGSWVVLERLEISFK